MDRDTAATMLAHLLHPIPIAVVAVGGLLTGRGLSPSAAVLWGGAVLAALFVPLISTIAAGRYTGRYASALLDQEERHLLYGIATATMWSATFVFWWRGAPHIVTLLSGVIATYVLVASIVNRFTKISVHAAAVTGSVVLVASQVPWMVVPGAAAVVGVCWSRVYEGKHTPHQVVLGAVLSAAIAAPVLLV